MQPSDGHYKNQTIRLPDLAVVNDVIKQAVFENCVIIGPAIVLPINGTKFLDSAWLADEGSLFWPIDPDRQFIIGAIILDNCQIYSCQLSRIGIAVPRDRLEAMQTGFTGPPQWQ